MIRISFTEQDIKQLRYERFHHPHPRVQRKTEAVLLKSTGMKHKDICGVTGICGNTLRSYLRDYADGGVERLTGIRRSENRVRIYLKSIGMKRRKVGMIPAKADPEKQERFVKEELNPRLKEAEQGRRAVFLSTPRISC
jgi:hypothetical protein